MHHTEMGKVQRPTKSPKRKIQPAQEWLVDIVRGTTNADAPLRQVSQHHQPFEDTYPQVTPTNSLAGFAANMYPDTAGPYIPVLYRLRLQKMARSYKNLEAEVSEMEEYTKGLHRPNQNTNNAYRDFRRDLDLLEEELFKLIEKYAVAETQAPSINYATT